MNPSPYIILASQSPRRRDLLEREGYDFEVFARPIPEHEAEAHNVEQIVAENARLKGVNITALYPKEQLQRLQAQGKRPIILAADTLVAMGQRVYGKPRDLEQAAQFMRELGGQPHTVLSGVFLGEPSTQKQHTFVETTTVELKTLSEAEIQSLFQRVTPLDKAAGYGFQDAPEIVANFRGSKTNVFGLPMSRLASELAAFLAAV